MTPSNRRFSGGSLVHLFPHPKERYQFLARYFMKIIEGFEKKTKNEGSLISEIYNL
jgi:hypothetical protein